MARTRSRTLNVNGNGVVPRMTRAAGAKLRQATIATKTGRTTRSSTGSLPTPSAAAPGTAGRSYRLNYMDRWNQRQRAAADAKLRVLNGLGAQGKLKKTSGTRGKKGAAAHWDSHYGKGKRPAGHDIDHTHELQLGGDDAIHNMTPLDASVNRSLGAQINKHIKGLPDGTPVGGFTIGKKP